MVDKAEMTDAQKKKREKIVLSMKDKEDEFKKNYGDRWKEVMYATATKMAMKEATDPEMDKIKQLVRLGFMDKKDMTKIVRAMTLMKDGKPVGPAERSVLFDMLNELIGMITGDQTMFQKAKKAVREAKEDDEPASPDEGGMAMRQLEFIEYAAEEVMDHIQSGKDFPEWMQNKLTKVHSNMEGLYSSLGDRGDDEMKEATVQRQKDNEKARQSLKDPSHNPSWAQDKPKLKFSDIYGKNKKESTEDDFGKNFGKRIGALVKGGKAAEYLKKKADQSRQRNKALDPGAAKKGLGIGVIDKDKANKKRMAREEIELDEVLDTPKAMQSYLSKAKASKEKAASSAAKKVLRGPDKDGNRLHPAKELKTMAKRTAGERMANKKVREEVELDEAAKTHFVYQRGVPKTKQVVHRGTEQSSKDWIQKNAKHYIHKGRDFDIYKGKYPNVKPSDRVDFKHVAEGVELEEAKMTDAKNKEMMRKALGVSKLGPKHANFTTAYANNGDFVVRDGAGRVVGRITKDELNEAKEPSMAKINAILNPTKNAEQGIRALMMRLKVDRKTAQSYMDKAMDSMKEGTNTADRKPEVYTDPNTGKRKIRMVPARKDIVKEVSADKADAAATERRKRMNKALDAGDLNKANRESDKMKKNVGHFIRKVGQGIKK